MNYAYSNTICNACYGDIRKGDPFTWGESKGFKVCEGCRKPVEVPAIDDSGTTYSEYQHRLFAAVARYRTEPHAPSIIVQGVAGCGKTFSILRASLEIPNLHVAYVVYNKANAEKAKKDFKVPAPHVTPTTFHAAGFAALTRRIKGIQLDAGKTQKILKAMIGYGENTITQSEFDAFATSVLQLVGLAKNHGVGAGLKPHTYDTWKYLVDHYGITFDTPEDVRRGSSYDAEDRGIKTAMRVLDASNEDTQTIDFDDQPYLTVKLQANMERYDVVFVDEVQDLNPTRRALLRMMVKPGGHVVAVGDVRQACYGFTGAEADSMDQVKNDWNAQELPLSINYRCSVAVLDAARPYCPQIEARPDAPQGSVETITGQFKLTDFLPTDAILCRLNAPGIQLAYRFIGAGIRVKVQGRDIGTNLINHARKLRGKGRKNVTLDELLERNEAYKIREINRWTAKGADDKAQSASDKCDSLAAAAEGLGEDERTVDGLIARLTTLFHLDVSAKQAAEEEEKLPPCVTISSVHRSKGLEWDRVFVLDPGLMPSKWARQTWMQVQEQNLIYISITRARQDLRYVNSDQIV